MTRNKQSGFTFTGFLVLLAIAGFAAFIGMKLFPMYQEYFAVRDAVKGLANEAGSGDMDPDQIIGALDKRFDVGYVDDIKRENIKIEKGDSGYVVHITWEERRPLVYNLDVVGKFDVQQALGHSTY